MKILNLKFMNIRILKGEWEIAFDRPPLADAGLFAIVGPNGAGKTSILDALTLALYGETSRLRDPREEIMSRREVESYAMATFSVGGDMYRSRWSIKKTDGKCGPPEMTLSSLNGKGKALEDRPTTVQTRIAELTGLDFKRFCRSVLLPQGEFAAFLNALESERAEILERIIGAELTLEQEASIRTAVGVESEKLRQLKETAAAISLMDEARLNELRESIERTKLELRETDRLLETLKARENRQEQVSVLASAEDHAAKALTEAEARFAESQSEYDLMERARKVIPFRSDFSAFEELKAEADGGAREMDRVETDIRSNRGRIGELEETLRRSESELVQGRQELEDRVEAFTSAILMDREITEESARFRDLVSRFENLEKARKENLQQQSEIDKEIAETKKKHEEIERWLANHGADSRLEAAMPVLENMLAQLGEVQGQLLDCQTRLSSALKLERRAAGALRRTERAAEKADKKVAKLSMRKTARDMRIKELLANDSLDSLVATIQEKAKRLAGCKRLVKIGKKYRKAAAGEDILVSLDRIQSEKDSVARSLALEQDTLAGLEKKRESEIRYATDRLLLDSGVPCPLCGSTNHPYRTQPLKTDQPLDAVQSLPDAEAAERELQAQRDKVNALKKEFEVLAARATGLQAATVSIQGLKQEWMEAVGPLQAVAETGGQWSITNLDDVHDAIRSCKSEIKQIKARIRSVRWQRWVADWWGRALKGTREKLSRRERQRDALRKEYESLRNGAADLKQEIEGLQKAEQEIKEVMTEKLADCGAQPPKPGKEMNLVQSMKERNETYLRYYREGKLLEKQLESLEGRTIALPGELEETTSRTAELATKVENSQNRLSELKAEREKLFGVMDPLREKQVLEDRIASLDAERLPIAGRIESIRAALMEDETGLSVLEDKVRETKAAADEAGRKLLERVALEGFNSMDEVEDHLLLLGDIEAVEEHWLNAKRVLLEARSCFEAARSALDAAGSQEAPGDPCEVVRIRVEEATNHRDAMLAEMETAERALTEQGELDLRYREVLRDIIEQEKICERVTAERNALQTDPAEAKSRLHKLMLERLIERSNRYLEMLSGRYYLRDYAGESFGLQVEDSFQEKDCRPVKTLSGGESFLVSLCLALGLSDLASKNRKIDSLFIDEGFGSLDDETLYRVIAALKGLQARGKMVGIISHIQRLAAEIPVRIKVERESGDVSRITIAA